MATRGFQPLRSLTGGCPIIRQYQTLTADGSHLFIGDPVEEIAGARVQKASAATSGGEILGVVASLYKKATDGRPQALTFSQPTNGPFLNTATSGWADVYVGHQQTYIAECDTTASIGMIGKNINGSAGTMSSAAGISGYILDTSTISASAALPFKVIGIADRSEDADGVNGPFGTSPILVEVIVNQGSLNTPTGI